MTQHPMFRTTDPETSREAALSITHLTEKQAGVLSIAAMLGEYTLEELVADYKKYAGLSVPSQSDSGIRTRHKELVDADVIAFTGKHAKTASGRRARVWSVRRS